MACTLKTSKGSDALIRDCASSTFVSVTGLAVLWVFLRLQVNAVSSRHLNVARILHVAETDLICLDQECLTKLEQVIHLSG